ncbi:MAG TPA: MarR family transcriptional regulator [Opitutaceae bacterium]|nr:MarR family transcriptional regulator [Opitutaceae bacterium]
MKTDYGFELTKTVMATADTFLRESARLFRPYGLTGAQYNVLNILADTPNGISQRELGDLLVVDRSNVTGLLDRLEKAGWVQRSDHPEDRRVYQVSLTPAGRALWEKVHPRYLEVVSQLTRGLSPKKMENCLEVLHQLEAGASTWTPPRD